MNLYSYLGLLGILIFPLDLCARSVQKIDDWVATHKRFPPSEEGAAEELKAFRELQEFYRSRPRGELSQDLDYFAFHMSPRAHHEMKPELRKYFYKRLRASSLENPQEVISQIRNRHLRYREEKKLHAFLKLSPAQRFSVASSTRSKHYKVLRRVYGAEAEKIISDLIKERQELRAPTTAEEPDRAAIDAFRQASPQQRQENYTRMERSKLYSQIRTLLDPEEADAEVHRIQSEQRQFGQLSWDRENFRNQYAEKKQKQLIGFLEMPSRERFELSKDQRRAHYRAIREFYPENEASKVIASIEEEIHELAVQQRAESNSQTRRNQRRQRLLDYLRLTPNERHQANQHTRYYQYESLRMFWPKKAADEKVAELTQERQELNRSEKLGVPNFSAPNWSREKDLAARMLTYPQGSQEFGKALSDLLRWHQRLELRQAQLLSLFPSRNVPATLTESTPVVPLALEENAASKKGQSPLDPEKNLLEQLQKHPADSREFSRAFEEFYQSYENFAFSIALSITNNNRPNAQEIVQDAFLAMAGVDFGIFNHPKALRKYFHTILKNTAYARFNYDNAKKRGGHIEIVSLDPLTTGEYEGLEGLDGRVEGNTVQDELRDPNASIDLVREAADQIMLHLNQREQIVLRGLLDGKPQFEIAQEIISPKTGKPVNPRGISVTCKKVLSKLEKQLIR